MAVGIAAVCRVPAGISATAPLLLEVWPRLGDDYVDGSSLPDTFAMTVLSDAGHDVALFGAGPDFFNGFTGRDQVWGGAGNDWIRTGQEADLVWGGDGRRPAGRHRRRRHDVRRGRRRPGRRRHGRRPPRRRTGQGRAPLREWRGHRLDRR